MHALLRSLTLVLALLVPGICLAQTGGDAYEGRVDVADQSPAARDPALREALAQVLARVSGPSAAAGAPQILARSSSLLSRYGYERNASGGLQLVAVFDRSAVDAQLRGAGLPVWGYAQAAAEQLPVALRGVQNTADYVRAVNALRALPGLRSLSVQSAAADHLQLLLSIEGGAARIASALAGNRDLALEGTASAAGLALLLRH